MSKYDYSHKLKEKKKKKDLVVTFSYLEQFKFGEAVKGSMMLQLAASACLLLH